MTRKQYLTNLKNKIIELSDSDVEIDIDQTVQYYSDYFDEFNDDEKVISELGSVEVLARKILEKKSNQTEVNQLEVDKSKKSENIPSDIIFYSFNKEDVRNLTLNFGAAEVVAIAGNKYSVETRGISKENFSCELSSDGLLKIINNKRINFNFWNHDRKTRVIPRILVTVPESAVLNRIKIIIGAGSFITQNIQVSFTEGIFEVGAGNLILDNFIGGKANIRSGMGSLLYKGKLSGVSNIDCGMGSLIIELKDKSENFSYDAKVGLGSFIFDNDRKTGVWQTVENDKKNNHLSVNCGMGSLKIKFN